MLANDTIIFMALDQKVTQEASSTIELQKQRFEESKARNEKNSWTQKQNTAYAIFLTKNAQLFINEAVRREFKVFRQLSQHIKTRTINQAKSHHQKMLIKHRTIPAIIEHLLNKKNASKPKAKKQLSKQVSLDAVLQPNKEEEMNPLFLVAQELQKGIVSSFSSQTSISDRDWFLDL